MQQEATAREVAQIAAYVRSNLKDVDIYSYGNEPEMQIDFHIPCDSDQHMVADTLAAMIPCLSRQHLASAFHSGRHVQLSLHKEPNVALAEAFFEEALCRIANDEKLAAEVAEQIKQNRALEIARVKARMERLKQLKSRKAD